MTPAPGKASDRMTAFLARQAARAASRIERDADIRESFKAGVSIRDLGRKYCITPERVRQIGKRIERYRE